ncbi:hypothetical protein [Zooshikella ganghwensis]|nr:hypothetical protein [Zooshikella ganghwensis]
MSSGWVDFRIIDNHKEIFHDSFSYTPYDSFLELINALHDIKTCSGFVEKKVTFNTEPLEYDFCFTKSEGVVSLEIKDYKDYRRAGNTEAMFAVKGSYDEICIPFWRGLRKLKGKNSQEELDRAWHRAFPLLELEKLTSKLKSK